MAPEQFVGTYDAKSDQYVLGCLAYELITGRPPFAVHNFDLMRKQHSSAEHMRLFKSSAHLPLSLEVAVLKSLAQDPDERFADFSLFIEIISFISSSLLTSTSPRSGNSYRKNVSSLLVKVKETETRSSSTKRSNISPSLVTQMQHFSPIMQSSLGGMSEMLISSFIPSATISESARSMSLKPEVIDNSSAQKNSSFITSGTLSETVKPMPLMSGTLDNTSAWQHSSFITSATLSGPATPTPLTPGTFGNISAWQYSSFIPLSEQATPIPLAESYAPIFPFPYPEQSRERSRSRVSLRSSKVSQREVFALPEEETELNLTSEKGHSSQETTSHHLTDYQNSLFLRSVIGLILLFFVILSLAMYVFWIR
jgi:hypothetical protein